MATLRPRPDTSLLLIVDIQERFLSPIWEGERVLRRAKFLSSMAALLGIPVLASEQVPHKMGATHPALSPMEVFAKEAFGCCEAPLFKDLLAKHGRSQIILTGIETHICVSQTALGLLDWGYRVAICPDAVSARTAEMHKLGMERIRDAGAAPIHTEAVAYEWLGGAANPHFKQALELVKNA